MTSHRIGHGAGRARAVDLQRGYDYHYWATRRVLDVVATLPNGQFARTVAGSYGSIRDTLVHVMSAEWGWLDRCGGPPRGGRLDPERYPTVHAVRDSWSGVESHMRAFLRTLGDADLARAVSVDVGGAPPGLYSVGDLLQHVLVHGAHHRGQVALLLRMLEVVPGNFDLLVWLGERAAAACGPSLRGSVRRTWTLPRGDRRQS